MMVTGTASAPRFNESRVKSLTIFDLTDHSSHSVRLFSWNHLPFQKGDLLTSKALLGSRAGRQPHD
jgi:hypothetical protein